MLKNRKRKIAVALTAAMLLGSVCVGNAGAISPPSIAETFNGARCTGASTGNQSGANSRTTCDKYSYAYAQCIYEYTYNGKTDKVSKYAEASDASPTATAYVTKPKGDGTYITGNHKVQYGGLWSRTTNVDI